MTNSELELFWKKINVQGPEECWNWVGLKGESTGKKYPTVWIEGKSLAAHRVAFELHHRPLVAGECVCHHCDNPRCCNPAHLFAGSHADNLADMTAKGRRAPGEKTRPKRIYRGDEHHARRHPERLARGERVGGAKLTGSMVTAIRSSVTQGIPQRVIAKRLGISPANINMIVKRRTWKHVA